MNICVASRKYYEIMIIFQRERAYQFRNFYPLIPHVYMESDEHSFARHYCEGRF